MSNPKPPSNSLKEREKRKRQVIKPVLDNPLVTVNWPFIQPDLAKDIVQHLTVLLNQIGTYNKITKETSKPPQEPEILSKITIGFNATTKQLETQARGKHKSTIKYVFVCKYDLTPSILTQHFPVLSFTASKGCKTTVKLIQLPKGTITELSRSMGVEDNAIRAGIIGLQEDIPQANALCRLLDPVADVEVPYLDDLTFTKLQVQYLNTTAPIGNPKKDGERPQKKPKMKVTRGMNSQSDTSKGKPGAS